MSVRELIAIALFMTPATIGVSFAGYLALHQIGGWGWFLFVAVVLSSVRIRTGKSAELHAQRELEQSRREAGE